MQAAKLVKQGDEALVMGVHTNHNDMTYALGAFLDARYAAIEKSFKDLGYLGDELQRLTLQKFHNQLSQITDSLKTEIIKKSIKGEAETFTDINRLFGNVSDLVKTKDNEALAKTLNEFFLSRGVKLE